jgi:hypothetical protein
MALSSYRYESRRSDDGLRDRLMQLARQKPRLQSTESMYPKPEAPECESAAPRRATGI